MLARVRAVVALASITGLVWIATVGASPLAPATPGVCCCFPAHEHEIALGCAGCFSGTHNCTEGFDGTVHGAQCMNYRQNSTCVAGGTTTITPVHYQCTGSPVSCGAGSLTLCLYTPSGSETPVTVSACSSGDTICPAGGTYTVCQ